eukprot:9335675-Pyramimonas_sp.AAC.1
MQVLQHQVRETALLDATLQDMPTSSKYSRHVVVNAAVCARAHRELLEPRTPTDPASRRMLLAITLGDSQRSVALKCTMELLQKQLGAVEETKQEDKILVAQCASLTPSALDLFLSRARPRLPDVHDA